MNTEFCRIERHQGHQALAMLEDRDDEGGNLFVHIRTDAGGATLSLSFGGWPPEERDLAIEAMKRVNLSAWVVIALTGDYERITEIFDPIKDIFNGVKLEGSNA